MKKGPQKEILINTLARKVGRAAGAIAGIACVGRTIARGICSRRMSRANRTSDGLSLRSFVGVRPALHRRKDAFA